MLGVNPTLLLHTPILPAPTKKINSSPAKTSKHIVGFGHKSRMDFQKNP